MKNDFYKMALVITLGSMVCANPSKVNAQSEDASNYQNRNTMNSFISIFEIPATNISRAINFYQNVLSVSIERMEFPGMEMGLFPYEKQMVAGVIMKGEGYEPSTSGITIYLNGGDNLQPILDKVKNNGGKIVVPKTPHADESGYFAIFHDSEGNKIGLHSPN